MRILMTGHEGYIGAVMAPYLQRAGHTVAGIDTGFFAGCDLPGTPLEPPASARAADVRGVTAGDLRGFDAVVHLAALSNDPLGALDADLTHEINHRASVRLAQLAREAGVRRFVFASSCSLYGVQGDDMLDESAEFRPLTAYGESKIRSEEDIRALTDDAFSPTFMRNATAYGVSPRLRADVVVNNLVGHAFTTGRVLIQSDGTPWRPLVHVLDFCEAFRAVLEAPLEAVRGEAFNVGRTAENYQVRDVAEIVRREIPGSSVTYAEGGGPDPRNYRVSCRKLEETLDYRPQWTVERGVRELHEAYRRAGLTEEEFFGERHVRLKRIRALLDAGRLDERLYWTDGGPREEARA